MCLMFVVVCAIKVGVDGIWLHMMLLENNTLIHLLCLCADADAIAAADDNGGAAFKDCKD